MEKHEFRFLQPQRPNQSKGTSVEFQLSVVLYPSISSNFVISKTDHLFNSIIKLRSSHECNCNILSFFESSNLRIASAKVVSLYSQVSAVNAQRNHDTLRKSQYNRWLLQI